MGKKTGIKLTYADQSATPLVQQSLADYVLEAGDTLDVYANGTALRIGVSEGATLQASGGTSSGILVYGGTSKTLAKGIMQLSSKAVGNNITVSGMLQALSGTTVSNAVIIGSGILYGNKASLDEIRLEDESSCTIYGGTLTNCTLNSGCSGVFDSSVTVNGLEVHSGASLTLGSNVTLQGTVVIGSRITSNAVSNAASATAKILMAELTATDKALIQWNRCAFGAVELSVESTPRYGTFALAEEADNFAAPVSLQLEGFASLNATVGNAATYHNSVYTLSMSGTTLSVIIGSYVTTTTDSQLNWGEINQSDNFTLALSSAGQVREIEVHTLGIDMFGFKNGTYDWQVRNSAESDNWQNGKQFTRSEVSEMPQELVADESNGLTDLFFAQYDGVWQCGYQARHVGNKGGWTGTLEYAPLEGKARITNVFAGSLDASILLLDDAENGAALFVDDVYSPAPGSADRARIAQIDTIIATGGDDIIDLTSQNFEFDGGVTVKGGAGNDYIWANSENNLLLGGDGDDNIVGGSGNDEISGGNGNDTLHGGGGADVFCFGANWGEDTVRQLANGSVVLWFLENSGTWDESTLTYTQGENSVSVSGVTSAELRFGRAAGYESVYDRLAAAGAFA